MLTEFGKRVRKARIDASVTMMEMATELETTPSFLSAIETGRKKVPSEWVARIESYFDRHGIDVDDLGVAAAVSNNSVSLEGLSKDHQLLVAGFARLPPSDDQVNALMDFVQKIDGGSTK